MDPGSLTFAFPTTHPLGDSPEGRERSGEQHPHLINDEKEAQEFKRIFKMKQPVWVTISLLLFAKQHTLLTYKSSSHLINVSAFGPLLT